MFEQVKFDFLRKTITKRRIATLPDKTDNFLRNLKHPTSVNLLKRCIGFVNFNRQYTPKVAKKLTTLYQLLQKDIKYQLTQVPKDDINENLAKTAKLLLRLPVPTKSSL